MRLQRFAHLRHPHLPWPQSAPATATQAIAILTFCLLGVGLAAILINLLIGLGFDHLPGGAR